MEMGENSEKNIFTRLACGGQIKHIAKKLARFEHRKVLSGGGKSRFSESVTKGLLILRLEPIVECLFLL